MGNYKELDALILPMASTDAGGTSGREDNYGSGDLD